MGWLSSSRAVLARRGLHSTGSKPTVLQAAREHALTCAATPKRGLSRHAFGTDPRHSATGTARCLPSKPMSPGKPVRRSQPPHSPSGGPPFASSASLDHQSPPTDSNVPAMRPSGLGWPEPPSTPSPARESPAVQPPLPQSPTVLPPGPTGEAKSRKKRWEWSGNALVAGVVSAIVAGGSSLLVTHVQENDSASQAAASQQVQAAQALEADANSLYGYTTDIYNFQRQCAGPHNTWQGCAAEAMQVYQNYNAVMTTFAAAGSNIADRTAAQLASQMAGASGGLITASSAADASKLWNEMVTVYTQLTERCGQLVQTQ
jgi:hypothetical protein